MSIARRAAKTALIALLSITIIGRVFAQQAVIDNPAVNFLGGSGGLGYAIGMANALSSTISWLGNTRAWLTSLGTAGPVGILTTLEPALSPTVNGISSLGQIGQQGTSWSTTLAQLPGDANTLNKIIGQAPQMTLVPGTSRPTTQYGQPTATDESPALIQADLAAYTLATTTLAGIPAEQAEIDQIQKALAVSGTNTRSDDELRGEALAVYAKDTILVGQLMSAANMIRMEPPYADAP